MPELNYATPHAGQAFGLAFACSRPCGELSALPDGFAAPALYLRWGDVPASLPLPHHAQGLWQACADAFLLTVPGVARYHVAPGGITVCPADGSDDASVRLFLFGSAIGALLHLRSILALHGSAVRLPDGRGVALFTGVSTAGKSTLAAALAQRGHALLSDDISAIRFDTGRPMVDPGLARCKLWGDALVKLNLAPDAGTRVRPDMDKYAIETATWGAPEPLTHVYEILPCEHGEIDLLPVKGLEKLRLLDRQTYRPGYIDGMGLRSSHLQRLGQLMGQVKIGQITRPRRKESTLDAIIALLERDWA